MNKKQKMDAFSEKLKAFVEAKPDDMEKAYQELVKELDIKVFPPNISEVVVKITIAFVHNLGSYTISKLTSKDLGKALNDLNQDKIGILNLMNQFYQEP